ncbi:glycerophosphodiester phosphodiesterase [Microbulbifer sp. ARAS458-1]|uniref:glycerophosphodiester phosphodiesterase n=1 Tax=Microbulbifer sp. ARAS458-1 TaxID=3140242 RepID=UPI00387815D4
MIAHGDDRGRGLYPGNTSLYLRKMLELGVDALEVDLNLTADDHLVLLHDDTLERTSDGRGLVSDKSLAELRELNAAYHWSADGEHFPYRDNPQPFISIDDAFAEFPQAPMIIELKNDDSRAACALAKAIEDARCHERVVVSSFHHGVIRTFRRICPRVATGATLPEALLFFMAQLVFAERCLAPSYRAMQLPMHYYGIPVFTRRFVSAAHRCGLHLSAWTVNHPGDMKKMITIGIDGVVTDRPDRLLSILKGKL